MGAFIVAGIIFAATVVISIFVSYANSMSSAPSQDAVVSPGSIFVTGTILAIIVASTHWLATFGW